VTLETVEEWRSVRLSAQSDLVIVRATLPDLPGIASLANQIWRAHYPGIISPAQIEYMLARMYAIETMQNEIISGGIRYDQLRRVDELVGFSAFGPSGVPDEFKLHKLYIHPGYQRVGLGTLLLKHVCEQVQSAGGRTLILAVNKANTQAIAAYRKNGFSIREAVVADIGEGFVMDDYIMQKRMA
jgi:ribosomal protein S18 acetylase RimI-like enzyme